jgi:hypothetical protein
MTYLVEVPCFNTQKDIAASGLIHSACVYSNIGVVPTPTVIQSGTSTQESV